MPLFLKYRDTSATELMDDPDCDHAALVRTYRQFTILNSLISRWKTIYKKQVFPLAARSESVITLLDIGFGGGDIPVKLNRWAEKDGIQLEITAIDNDERAYRFVRQKALPESIHFRLASTADLIREGSAFDIVISNHLLHHLDGKALASLFDDARRLSTNRVLFNDIERSDAGYLLFNLLSRPFFRRSFITRDGLTSIRRSFTFRELKETVPDGWKVSRLFPFRLLARYHHA
ncbi:MAG: methyltransferase domain-containing protein [Balneolaceae bacterium]|nr:methyltransferase domain-containing protein [Balneolaceae bacterium]